MPIETAQLPEPIEGMFPVRLIVVVLPQIVWSIPALETVGMESTKIETVSVEAEHTPLLMVQVNVFTPESNPVMLVLGKEAFVIIPEPEINNHRPVPVIGELPESTTAPELPQIV